MKKLVLALTVVCAMIAGFASMAAAEVTVGGSAEIRYDLWKNINLNTGASDFQSTNFFDERVMVNVDAKVTQGLEGFVEFDTDNYNWGQQNGNIPTYLNHEAGAVIGTQQTANWDAINVRQAWINAMVPGIPVGVKIGHQPLALGHGIWLDTSRYGSDAILAYAKPMPALLVAGAYVQMSQNPNNLNSGALDRISTNISGSTDALDLALNTDKVHSGAHAYAALANYTWMPNNTVGVNFTYVRDHSSLDNAFVTSPPSGGTGHRIWATNVGIPVDGTIGMVTYKGEFDWLYTNTKNIFGATGTESYTESGFAAMLGANANVMKMANVGIEAAYGTGNSAQDPQIFYNPGGAAPGGTKHMDHAYYTPYNSTGYNYAFLYNDKIGQGPLGTGGGFGYGDGYGGFGLANTGYIKVSGSVTPTDRLKAGLDFLYLRASEAALPGQSRDLGWELDGHADYKLYDNLTLNLTGGVFDPGAWYSYKGHAAVPVADAAILTDPSNLSSPIKRNVAWGMETKLTMKF